MALLSILLKKCSMYRRWSHSRQSPVMTVTMPRAVEFRRDCVVAERQAKTSSSCMPVRRKALAILSCSCGAFLCALLPPLDSFLCRSGALSVVSFCIASHATKNAESHAIPA